MKLQFIPVAILSVLAAACTSTEEAQQVLQSRWIGQPVDSFFMRYGAPVSSYRMANGSQIYTWRGGEKQHYNGPVYSGGGMQKTTIRSSDGDVVTIKTPEERRMISPGRTELLFCELQITASPDARIVSLRTSNDTVGAGITSISRCSEVLDATVK